MCDGQCEPSTVPGALAMLDHALDFLVAADSGALPTEVQAQALLALERAEAKHTAARARLLATFTAQAGYEADAHASARSWLRWRARVTRGAAAGAVGWARRLAAHPVIRDALAAGEMSASWAKEICGWSDRLPDGARDGADVILAGAARAGAELTDLAGLAEEMYARAHREGAGGGPDERDADRGVWLGVTLGGAGRLEGDLTAGCSAALTAVLEALGKRAGPEDIRTAAQRRHDALEVACQRLLGAGLLPARAGQPAQALVHITLSQLRGLPGAPEAEAAWLAARAGQPGWLAGPEAGAAACDASVVPVVTGQADPAALDRLTAVFLASHGRRRDGSVCGCGGCSCPPRQPLSPQTMARLREAMLRICADVLSGPAGLAAWLRHRLLEGPAASPSLALGTGPGVALPLDAGHAEPAVPGHLRRAVTTRHPHCAFPGCDHPATGCHIHHLVPRARGGPTTLGNLVPVCPFHHLTAIHRWGWTLTLHADGTTTAASPDRTRVLHSHGPPGRGHAYTPRRLAHGGTVGAPA
jgi:Domain of unknown function (DUF222)/HNH endonuclease